MKIVIDMDQRQLTVATEPEGRTVPLYSPSAFEILSKLWLKVSWSQKYSYGFTWLGRPLIQLPADVVRVQEVIYRVKPTLVIETGVAHGGSLVLYASLLYAMKIRGRVIGIDVTIRPPNRAAIEQHQLAEMITLIEGDSVGASTIARAKGLVNPSDTVLVVLDSCHTKAHVAKEIEAYHGLVSPGSYMIVTDGVMRDLYDVPPGQPEWRLDNPCAAAEEFAARHPEFILEEPPRLFNESQVRTEVTHWPNAYLRRRE